MDKQILGYACKKCSTLHYPNRSRCRKCGHHEFDTQPLPTQGKLLTFTRLHTLPADFDVLTLSLGIVELENGQRITAQLDIDEPKIGMKVKGHIGVVRQEGYQKFHGMIFTKG